ncbi:MAG: ABC transporter permease subunit, partial [Planctomycetales bacterium]
IYSANAATADMDIATLQILPGIFIVTLLAIAGLKMCSQLMPLFQAASFQPLRTFRLGRWQYFFSALTIAILIVLFGLPIANLIYEAGIKVELTDSNQLVRTWSGLKLLDMMALGGMEQAADGSNYFEPKQMQFYREIGISLALGSITASTSLVLATLLAWFGSRNKMRAWVMYLIVGICFALPGPLIGMSVSRLLVHFPSVYDSFVAPCMAQTLRALPLTTIIVWFGLRTISEDILDAGRLAAASNWSRFWHLLLPLVKPAMVVAWLAAFLVAIGDLSASHLLELPGRPTLANRVFDRLHSGAYDQVSGMFLTLLIFLCVVSTAIVWIAARWFNRQSVDARQEF